MDLSDDLINLKASRKSRDGIEAEQGDVDGEEEDGEEEDPVALDDSIYPGYDNSTYEIIGRKLARRKTRVYRFDSNLPATEKELRELFRSFSNSMANDGNLNAIQLSNIWRLVTGEKGNLFKEMKLFHK